MCTSLDDVLNREQRQMERQADRRTDGRTDRRMDRQTDTDRQRDRQTDRQTDRCICTQMKSEFSYFCYPLQHGVSTKGETDLPLHHIQLLLGANNNWIVLKTDAKNAFNSIHHLLQQTTESFPILTSHVKQFWVWSSDLSTEQCSGYFVISRKVHQGDLLGPVLFSLGIQQTLVDLQSKFPSNKSASLS